MNAFPKSVRLHHKDDFRRALDRGVKVVGTHVVIYLQPRPEGMMAPEDGGSRLGLIVSRKVGNAIVRNRVKRHLREAYRNLRPELEQFACLWRSDVVVVARVAAAASNATQMSEALQHGLRRLKRQIDA